MWDGLTEGATGSRMATKDNARIPQTVKKGGVGWATCLRLCLRHLEHRKTEQPPANSHRNPDMRRLALVILMMGPRH